MGRGRKNIFGQAKAYLAFCPEVDDLPRVSSKEGRDKDIGVDNNSHSRLFLVSLIARSTSLCRTPLDFNFPPILSHRASI